MTTGGHGSEATLGRGPGHHRLAALLRVHEGEGRLVGWVSALFAVTQAGHGLGSVTADTLFFLRFGVEYLPLMILLSGPLVMVATLAYAAGLGHIGAARWLSRTLAAFSGWLLLEWAGVVAEAPAIYPVVWLGAQVAILVSFTVMWNAAGEVCTSRQAKRLYPLFASAGIAGGIAGNALAGPLAALVGASTLLLVHAGLLAAGAVLVRALATRFFPPRADVEQATVLEDVRAGLDLTRRIPLLRLAASAAVGISILFFLVVFPFSEAVARSFDTEAEMAGFLGLFSSAATATTFLVSLLGANRLFGRIGVVGTLAIVPLVYVLGFGMWLASFGLVTASLVRGAQWVSVNALGGTAWSSVFNVLPATRRGQVMAFVAAVPTQLGTSLAGAILLLGSTLPLRIQSLLGLTVALATGWLVLRMRPEYGQALLRAVREGLVDVLAGTTPGMQKPALDADALHALGQALHHPSPGTRAVAARMLGRLSPDGADPLLTAALEDGSPEVRLATLEGLAETAVAPLHAERLLLDPSPRVRRRAVEVLQEHGASPDPALLEQAMHDPHPEVSAGAAALAGTAEARAVVAGLLDSEEPGAIRAALRAVARRPELTGADLARFTLHPDRRVREAAIGAMAGGEEAGAVLGRLLDDASVRVREEAARALAQRDETVPVLLATLATGSVRASDAALRGLVAAGRTGGDLLRWAASEVERAAFLRRHRLALDGEAATPTRRFLIGLLRSREQRLEEWALIALTTPGQEAAMALVRRGIRADDPETKDRALEALDSIGERSVTGPLLALLEGTPDGGRRDARSSLEELARDHDDWIRALAVRCLAEELAKDLEQLRSVAGGDASPLVRAALSGWETAMPQDTHTLDTMDRVVALQRVPMFSQIDPEDLERVATVVVERRFDPGEVIFRCGEEGDEMLVIIQGEVEVRRPDGELITTYGAGEHVGELALLRRRHRAADVIGGEAGVLGLCLAAPELQSILEERPEVALAMLATLAERLGRM